MKGIGKLSAEERGDALNGLAQVREVIAEIEGKMGWPRKLEWLWKLSEKKWVETLLWVAQTVILLWVGWKAFVISVVVMLLFRGIAGIHKRARRKVMQQTQDHFDALYEQKMPLEFIEKIWLQKV